MSIIDIPGYRAASPGRKQREEQLLATMQRLTEDREALRRQQFDLVTWCRDEGITWAAIGAAMGMSGEGVQRAHRRRTSQSA